MLEIKPSPTADTRTCDYTKVTEETLLALSKMHINDIQLGLLFWSSKLAEAAERHDHDKISDISGFHQDFITGFKQTKWWDNHRKVNRHHISMADGIPTDVDLVDVFDFIVDCCMAGMARSGSVYELKLPPELLDAAFQNTVKKMVANIRVSTP
jgi:hypothetical protein